MLKTPKFSILTACYNSKPFLFDYFKSIEAQKYRPLELVFVNDCCTDYSVEIFKFKFEELKKQGISIKYINNKKRLRCGGSYYAAVCAATGDFFGVLDSDDMLLPNAVNFIMKLYMKYKDIGWMYSQFQTFTKKGNKINFLKRGFSSAPSRVESLLSLGKEGKHAFSHWRTFSRRVKNYESVFCKKLSSSVDKYMGYKLEELSIGMFVNKILYLYRKRFKKCVSISDKPLKNWREVKKEAFARRKKKHIVTFPVRIFTGKI